MGRRRAFGNKSRVVLSVASVIAMASCSMQQPAQRDVARSTSETATIELQDSERSRFVEYVGEYIGGELSFDLLSAQSRASLSRIGVQDFDSVYAALRAGNQQDVFRWLADLGDSIDDLSDAELAIVGLDMRGVIYEQRFREVADASGAASELEAFLDGYQDRSIE